MAKSLKRQALIANGLLVMAGSVLSVLPWCSGVGGVVLILMGLSLIFSGATDFCGWVRILALLPGNRADDIPSLPSGANDSA